MKAKEALASAHTSSPIFAFPAEPVGPGAKWEVKTNVKTNGMTVGQTAIFQLTSVEGDRISVNKTVDFTMNGTPQMNQNSGAMVMAMGSMKIDGQLTGSSAMDLSKLIPTQANLNGQLAFNMSMKGPKGNQPISAKANLSFTIESH